MRIVVKYSIAFWQYSTAVLVGGLDKLVHCVRFFRQPLIFQPQYRNVTTYQSKWGQNQSITYGKIEQRLRSKTTADDQFAGGSILLDQRKVKYWRPFSQFVGNGNLTLVSKWMYVKGSGWTPLQKPAFQFFNNFTFAFFWKVLFFHYFLPLCCKNVGFTCCSTTAGKGEEKGKLIIQWFMADIRRVAAKAPVYSIS